MAGLGVVEAGDGPGVGAEPAREEGVEGRPRGVAALAAVDAEALDEAANTVNTRSPSRLPSRLLSRVPSRFPSRFPGRFPRDWRHLAFGFRRLRALRRSRWPAIRRPSRAGPYPSLNQGDGFCVWRGPAQRETRRLRPTPRLAPPPPRPSMPARSRTRRRRRASGGRRHGRSAAALPVDLADAVGAVKLGAVLARHGDEGACRTRGSRLFSAQRASAAVPALPTAEARTGDGPGDKAGEAGRESWRGLSG